MNSAGDKTMTTMKHGPWKIMRTKESAPDYQYKVARLVSDGSGAAHVVDFQYCDTREEAEELLKIAKDTYR